MSLFRHSIWVYYSIQSLDQFEIYLYIYGGFDGDNSAIINSNLYRINVFNLFSKDDSLKSDLYDYINTIVGSRPKPITSKVTSGKDDNAFIMDSKVVASVIGDEFADIVKKHSLQNLKEEGKKTRGQNGKVATKYVYDEQLIKLFVDIMPLPENFEPKAKGEEFPFYGDHVISLVQQAINIFIEEPTLIKLRSPIKIFGSLDGQINDLLKYFCYWGRPHELKGDIECYEYLFLGNIAGRGEYSLETLCLILALKVTTKILRNRLNIQNKSI